LAQHQLEGFDCGEPGLNRFLLLHALKNQRANSSRNYVALRGEQEVSRDHKVEAWAQAC
jgi:hypothetical protein